MYPPIWKENLNEARHLLELAQKGLVAGDETGAVALVRGAILCLGTEIQDDFMAAACSCGHAFGAHGLVHVPEEELEREDAEAISSLFLRCQACSKRCVELMLVPTAVG